MFRFEKLDVWVVALEFTDAVYAVTRAFPADERFRLTNQLRRAAVSISASIAEGAGRTATRDRVRFIEIAYGSLLEVTSHLHVASRQQMLAQTDFDSLYAAADRLGRMLSGFRSSMASEAP